MSAVLSRSHDALAAPAPSSFNLTVQQALLQLDRIAVRRGVQLTIETDPTEFAAITLSNEKTQARLMPVLDFRLHDFDPSNFMWLKGEDANGSVVATSAIRLLRMGDLNLKQFGESLRLFYGDFRSQALPGETYTDDCESAPMIEGRVTFSGGIWIDPHFRGAGEDGLRLSQILGRFVRLIARLEWDPDYCHTAITSLLHSKGMAEAYGWPRAEPGITWTRPGCVTNQTRSIVSGSLLWMSRSELDADTRWVADRGLTATASDAVNGRRLASAMG
jgi:hypothetical protein